MRIRPVVAAVLAGVLWAIAPLAPTPARADHQGGDRYGYDEGCGRDGAGCNNERDEDYSSAGCKYVCPSFDKSPVHDAFNFSPFICAPGATCYEDGRRRSDEPPPEDQPPQ